MLAVYILRSHLAELKKAYAQATKDEKMDEARKILVEIRHTEKVIARRIAMYQNPN